MESGTRPGSRPREASPAVLHPCPGLPIAAFDVMVGETLMAKAWVADSARCSLAASLDLATGEAIIASYLPRTAGQV